MKKFIALGADVAVETGRGRGRVDRRCRFRSGGRDGRQPRRRAEGRRHHPWRQRARSAIALRARHQARCSSARSIRMRRRDAIDGYAAAGLEALAMEFMPRITRAQSMDILSSQSNLAGYKAVIDAAAEYGRAFPMMMTAAGTISPAKVFVMGVGVAGLQAIATARRLGAQVSATDVRSATKEQIQSLGAKPIFVENVAGIEGEGAGGYATEMSRRISEGAGRAGLRPHRQAGHRHHHRADPRPSGAAADQRRADRDHAAGQRRSSISRRTPAAMSRARSPARAVEKHGVTIIGAANLARSLAGRRLGAVRAQPLQFPQRLLGQGGGASRAPRRRRDREGRSA